ncbi:Nuclear pore complex nucleoporin component [Rhizophlyctis rosea]|uniref:mRNA export factor GLE1 n=1 Tax=Rhizophlyctis rosea TaxID=64517 RepID=A0AAD5X3C0_9FUNG|nr:Nuclear pore complex nucleoporin component [Rhizophlyctis rosea]
MVQFGYDDDGEDIRPVPRTPSPRKTPQKKTSSTGKAEALRAAQLSALASRTPSPLKALKMSVEEATTAQLEAAMHRLLQINDAIRAVPFMTAEESQAYLAQQRARVQEFEKQRAQRHSAAQQYLKRLTEEIVNDEGRLAEARKALEAERAKKQKEEKERAEARAKAEAEEKRKQEEEQKARDAQAKALADAQNAKKAQDAQKAAAEKQKQDAEKQRQQQQAAAAAAAAASIPASAAQGFASAAGVPGADCSAEAWKTAEPLLARLKTIKNDIRPKAYQPAYQTALMKAKMDIKARIGQQTMSQKKIITIAKHVSKNLEDGKGASQEVYETLLDITAKCIVQQAEREVAVKTSQAYPLALISVMLYTKHEPLLDILLGRLYKKCPYLIPQYFKKIPGEGEDQQRKRIGMKMMDDNWETEEHFWERMGGMVALYAGIVQTTTVPHKYDMDKGWIWLARTLNMKPRRITPVLIYKFLEVAAFRLEQTYRQQIRKLMQYIYETYIPAMAALPNPPTPSITRLQSFIHDQYLQNGKFDEPAGIKLEA